MSEEYIIQQCKKGDHEAFRILLDKYAPILMGVCMRYLRNENQAKDALQESFIKIFNNFQKLEDYKAQKAWMIKIAVNTCLRELKSMKTFDDIDDKVIEDVFELSFIEIIETESLLMIIDRLPENWRMVFNLHVVEGYSHKEIAEMLKIPEASSRVYLTRARKALQAMIKEIEFTN